MERSQILQIQYQSRWVRFCLHSFLTLPYLSSLSHWISTNMNVTALSQHQSSTSSFHCWCSIFSRRQNRPVSPAQRLIHLRAHYRPVCSRTENTVPNSARRGKHGSSFTVKAAETVSRCSLWFLPGHEVCLGLSIMIATSSAERYSSLLAPGNNSKRGCVLNGCGNACQIKLQTQPALGQKKTDGERVRQNDVTIKSIHLCGITFFF